MRKEFELNLKASILGLACVIIGALANYMDNRVIADWALVTMFICIVVGGTSVIIGAAKDRYEEIKAERNSKKKQKA